ncbi:hypothetical protein Tco_1549552 [Tanacetum coccineum]
MLPTNVQGTQVTEDTHVIITNATPEVQQQSSSVSSGFISNMLNPNPDIGIDSILNLNTESTSLVDVPISTNVEMPPSSVTTLPLPPIPLFQPQHQIPVPLPAIVPSTSLQNLPIFGSLFKFEDRVKGLEDDFLEFKQTNQFAEVVSSIPDIVFTYLANKMNEAVKIDVKLYLVNDPTEAEVLTYSSNQAKTSHAIAANLSELELKKILIDKMENNKSIDRSIQRRAGKEPESTSVPKEKTSKSTDKSKEGSKSHHTSTGKSAQAKEAIHADKDLEEPSHQEFDTGFTKDQPADETTQHLDWFQKPTNL